MPKPKLEIKLVPEGVNKRIAALVKEHHPNLKHATIAAVFVSKENKRGGLDVGRALRTPDLVRLVCSQSPHFILRVPKPVWDRISEEQQEALLDRLLCSCWYDQMKAKIMPPDFNGYFKPELMRYGFWIAEIEDTARYWQPRLLDDADESPDEFAARAEADAEAALENLDGFMGDDDPDDDDYDDAAPDMDLVEHDVPTERYAGFVTDQIGTCAGCGQDDVSLMDAPDGTGYCSTCWCRLAERTDADATPEPAEAVA